MNRVLGNLLARFSDELYDKAIDKLKADIMHNSHIEDSDFILAKKELERILNLKEVPDSLDEFVMSETGIQQVLVPRYISQFEGELKTRHFFERLYIDIFGDEKDFKPGLLKLIDPETGMPSKRSDLDTF
jgi:hypothetical protein